MLELPRAGASGVGRYGRVNFSKHKRQESQLSSASVRMAVVVNDFSSAPVRPMSESRSQDLDERVTCD